MGCLGLRVEDPKEFAPVVERGIAETGRPTIVDVVVTRDPAKMLPGVDSRTAPVIKKGDRIACRQDGDGDKRGAGRRFKRDRDHFTFRSFLI